jgi:hypothetical protein
MSNCARGWSWLLLAACSVDDRVVGIRPSESVDRALPGDSTALGSATGNAAGSNSSTNDAAAGSGSGGPPGVDTSSNPGGSMPMLAGAGGSSAVPEDPTTPSLPQDYLVSFGGDGFGRIEVTSLTGKQDCETSCTLRVTPGERLTLLATARPYSTFVSWTGVCGASAGCSFDVDPSVPLRVDFQLAYNVAFISSRTYAVTQLPRAGDAANQECAQLAAAAGVHGARWVAWLAADGSSAAVDDDITPDRALLNPGGWVRRDGVPLARTRSALLAGALLNPLNRSELGDAVAGATWAGADSAGRVRRNDGTNADDCQNWTSVSDTLIGTIADSTVVGINWSGGGVQGCNASAPIFCFGDDVAPEVPLPARDPSRRLVFVSAANFEPGAGIQAADDICQREACAAGLTGSSNCATNLGSERLFLAYLHSSQGPAWARFDPTRPGWVRVDGVDWLPLATDLTADAAYSLTGVNVQADGTLDSRVSLTWVGKPDGTECCDDWTNSAATGAWGVDTEAGYPLSRSFRGGEPCTTAAKVLCLEW